MIGAHPSRVHVAGNLKYDIPVPNVPEEKKTALRGRYRIPDRVPVFTAGSTHQGEEEAVLAACVALAAEGTAFFLVLAPRHPERAGEVAELLGRFGIPFARRSSLDERTATFAAGEALLVDTVGELMDLYSVSDLVFVGGSLVPVGGHNLLEAALLQKAALHGPHMHNFREIAAWIGQAQGFGLVQDVTDLTAQLDHLLREPERCRRSGTQAWQLLQRHAGASARTLEALQPLLQRRGIDS